MHFYTQQVFLTCFVKMSCFLENSGVMLL